MMQRLIEGQCFTRRDIAVLFGRNARAFLPRVNGGDIVVEGTPETVAAYEASFTGQYLRPLLERHNPSPLEGEGDSPSGERGEGANDDADPSPFRSLRLLLPSPSRGEG